MSQGLRVLVLYAGLWTDGHLRAPACLCRCSAAFKIYPAGIALRPSGEWQCVARCPAPALCQWALAERAPERPLVAHLAAQEDGIFHSVSICLITILANPFFPFMRLRSYPRSSSALASDLALPAGICCASHHSFHEAKSWPVVVQANGPPSAVHSSSH